MSSEALSFYQTLFQQGPQQIMGLAQTYPEFTRQPALRDIRTRFNDLKQPEMVGIWFGHESYERR